MDDLTLWRVGATVASFITFLGIVWWAYARSNRERLQAAALIPFDHD
ncbi:cbb3-type cytochrome c oxidase subunit 3 [Ramlibacter sp.]|nr:cbb3-type cytochrome c oxidase subunit 3 [Ramlibacter sp.]HWI81192.1 cbb3-type cytochrome c oxidase subunit 3 [Ramlibacter sp.]